MNFINKSTLEEEGNSIINSLLEISWINEQAQYINANYKDGLCNNQFQFYTQLTDILLTNQQFCCCYCMKNISLAETTLEHIIPHKTKTQEDFNKYLISGELNNNVIYMPSFDRHLKIIPPRKIPS